MAEINIFAGNFAPMQWAFCDGSLMSIAENTALFSLLGTTYGGDGQQTFALPDLRGRVPVGTGNGQGLPSFQLGEMGGTENTILLASNLPSHTHTATTTVTINGGTNSTNTPSNAYWGNANTNVYTAVTDGTLMNASAIQITPIAAPTGGAQPISNMDPFLAMNYIICVEGIYPSRN